MHKANIYPGPGFEEAVEEAGFDLEQFKPKNSSSSPPPRKQQEQALRIESLQTLQTILNQVYLSNLSAEDEESLFTQIQQADLMTPGNLFTIDT